LQNQKNVLICPLTWGLGHATRCVPVAYNLINKGYNVIFAVNHDLLAILKPEFPEVTFILFPSVKIMYSRKNLWLKMLFQIPKFFQSIFIEHQQLKKIVGKYHISVVISDNRYGCFTSRTKNYFITHQVSPKLPKHLILLEWVLKKIIQSLIHRFNHCWIPDDPVLHLSGNLSKHSGKIKNIRYIGILSRFTYVKAEQPDSMPEFEWLAVISGPEPQRSVFQQIVLHHFRQSQKSCLLLCGQPWMETDTEKTGNVYIVPHLPTAQLKYLVLHSKFIICRSGYSSIMDLISLQKTALLVPTPGQTEQEYLGKRMSKRKLFVTQHQDKLNLPQAEKFLTFDIPVNYQQFDITSIPDF
jgi:predicted glycosyltransferase